MFDNGKILSAGGSPNYDDNDSTTAAYVTTISNVSQAVKNDQVSNMNYPRIFANGVVLPDGTVHVTGGQTHGKGFADDNGVLSSELFNPKSNSWTIMARESVARNYHSASVLLADARVWSGGGGLCYNGGDCRPGSDHPNGQIWSPPYLFNSDGSASTRPVITSVSSTVLRLGSSFTVQMGDRDDYTFSLIRLGSATHSVNTDQRRISVSGTKNANFWSITLPNDSGVMIPGSWYVFAMSGNGVPSWAKTVRVTN
jgi:galactose oxidase